MSASDLSPAQEALLTAIEAEAQLGFAEAAAEGPNDDALLEQLVESGLQARPGLASSTPPVGGPLKLALPVATMATVVATVVVGLLMLGEAPEPAPAMAATTSEETGTLDQRAGPVSALVPIPEPPAPPVSAPAPEAPTPEALTQEAKPGVERTPAEDKLGATEMLVRANNARNAHEHRRARKRYRALIVAWPESREALAARLHLAKLELRQFKSPQRARAQLRDYLRHAPTGNLAEEARLVLVQCAEALDDLPAERDALESFLKHHPGSPHAARLGGRLDELPSR